MNTPLAHKTIRLGINETAVPDVYFLDEKQDLTLHAMCLGYLIKRPTYRWIAWDEDGTTRAITYIGESGVTVSLQCSRKMPPQSTWLDLKAAAMGCPL
jgi:hypothetical protein